MVIDRLSELNDALRSWFGLYVHITANASAAGAIAIGSFAQAASFLGLAAGYSSSASGVSWH